MDIGTRMKECRLALGLSAEQVAEKLNVNPATIYRYEKGDIEKMPSNILKPLADLLCTTPSYLMGWETTEKVASFKDRIIELVSTCGKSQSTIASEFGVSKQTISAWINGQTIPRTPVQSALSQYFGVSFAWLMGYDVPKFLDEEQYKAYEKFVDRYFSLTDDERHILDLFNNADERAKRDALRLLEENQLSYSIKQEIDVEKKAK